MSERQAVSEGSIVGLEAVTTDIERDAPRTELPIGVRVERREGNALPGINRSPAVRDARPTRAYTLTADQMRRLELEARRRGCSVAQILEGER